MSAPPAWALLQRRLMDVMEEGAVALMDKYTERGGAQYYADCVDDLYEMFYDWGLFYAMGAGEVVLDKALDGWNAVTRCNDDGIVHRAKHGEFRHGAVRKYTPQLHREFFNKATMSGAGSSEWHHIGEACVSFYHFGLADPTISENVRRARAFAAMFMGEDPLAPNFDTEHGIFRSPIQTSEGPYVDGNIDKAVWWLQGVQNDKPLGPMTATGKRATLYPVAEYLEEDWFADPVLSEKVVRLFERIVLRGDTPQSLAAAALITNAYMYTGDEKYRKWVLDYAELWLGKIRENGGVVPDNIGPTGKIGEHREGQWWGGLYGWSARGYSNIFNSLTVGAECALLLSGDYGYLELLRSQVQMLMEKAVIEEGRLVTPAKYGPDGWFENRPFPAEYAAHLFHASMDPQDHALMARIAQASEPDSAIANRGLDEWDRLQFYAGKDADWPGKALSADLNSALETLDWIRRDDRDVETMIADNLHPGNPVLMRAMTRVGLGAPSNIYNGGLVQAVVRYFDQDRARPGLPEHVAALVDSVESDRIGLQLVNTSPTETRTVLVQAGAFGQHSFGRVRYEEGDILQEMAVDGKYFSVELRPATSIRLDIGLRRFVNRPTYAFPWHQDGIPVPFQ